MNSSKTDMLVRACLKPRAQELQDFLKDLQLPCLCPQPVAAYSGWPQMDGIFCEDPIREEALMPPCPDFCVTFNVANFSPGLPQKGLRWFRHLVPVITQVGSGMFVPMMGSHGLNLGTTNIFPLSALYLFPDPACW